MACPRDRYDVSDHRFDDSFIHFIVPSLLLFVCSLCLGILPPTVMVNNWSILSADSKTLCKLAFELGMVHDSKPEVQNLAKAGMISYLSMKPSKELKIIAEAYIKNSEALADR